MILIVAHNVKALITIIVRITIIVGRTKIEEHQHENNNKKNNNDEIRSTPLEAAGHMLQSVC